MLRNTWLAAVLLSCISAAAETPLVTGNGFGFALYSVKAPYGIRKLYAHPYRFERPDPADPLSEGIETSNLVSSLSWRKPAARVKYAAETHVISSADGDRYFMPFGLHRGALIALTRKKSCLEVQWAHPILKVEEGPGWHLLSFAGIGERVLMVRLGEFGVWPATDSVFCGGKADKGVALMVVEPGEEPQSVFREFEDWRDGAPPRLLAKREVKDFETWRVAPPPRQTLSPIERRLWRQSETVLRMAQSREPNREGRHNNGMILASLPEGMWFVTWVRDMAYAALALIRMGHQAEARAALMAYFNARPVGRMQAETGGLPYQISVVRYFGDGSEEPFFTMEGTYNIEFDNWGLVLWVLSEYVERFGDTAILNAPTHRGPLYEVARDLIYRPLRGNFAARGDDSVIIKADTSIWENYPWDQQHFAYTTAAAIRGLSGFASVAGRAGDAATQSAVKGDVLALSRGFLRAFASEGFVSGTEERGEKNLYDSAALEAINLVSPIIDDLTPEIIRATMANMHHLKMPSGGYRRVRGDTNYEKQEFLFSNFALALAHLQLGERKAAQDLVQPMVRKAARDSHLIPEMYVSEVNDQFPGAIGAPTGSIPMVGYGAGVYVMYQLAR